jgi:restriction endonuclease S subunit
MTPQQQEITKLEESIMDEMKGLYTKYLKIFDWDIPENDEQAATRQILEAMQRAIEALRQEHLAK